MNNRYCKQCGKPSNGYPLCKSCYYQQRINNDEYEGGTQINIDLGAIVQGIASIVQCFKSPQENIKEPKIEKIEGK